MPLLAAIAAGRAAAQSQNTSTQANPAVTFSSPGKYTVTLTVCNNKGCSPAVQQTVTVLNPMPVVTVEAAAPAIAYVGQPIYLTGLSNGQPQLSYSWQVGIAGVSLVTLPGQNLIWNTAGLAPGTYTLLLSASNGSGSASAPLPATVLLLPPVGLHFYTVAPCRALDTRLQSAPLVSGAALRLFTVATNCGIPPTARSVAFNLTAVNPTSAGYIAVFPGDYPQALVNSINFNASETIANFAVLPLSTDGVGTVAAMTQLSAAGHVDLLLDVSGYYAP